MRKVATLAALLAAPCLALAQAPPPAPPRPPRPTEPARPAAPPRATSPATTPRPANPPARANPPVVNPRPGAPGRPVRPPHPPARPAPRPAAPVVVPPAPPPEPEKPTEPAKGSNTGLPLPRFAALRSEEVNLRAGPGVRYPIEWVYKRRDLPVQIEREFEIWRLVRDQEGVKGWVHQATLAPRRTAVVIGTEQVLRAAAQDNAVPVAKLKPGVILRLRSCEAASEWCQAQVQDYRGWIRRNEVWGVAANEAVQ